MGSNNKNQNSDQLNPSFPTTTSSNQHSWKQRILIPTLLAGVAGGGFGLVSKHRKVHGVSQMAATYATNFAIVTGCYCGAREFVRVSRAGKPDDLFNSLVGGVGSGAILGRLQGGQAGAVRYAVIFGVVGTAADYALIKLKPFVGKFREEKDSWLQLPEWSPIRILDEEAVAAKRAREEELFAKLHSLNKEES